VLCSLLNVLKREITMKMLGVIIMSLLSTVAADADAQILDKDVLQVLNNYAQGTERHDVAMLEKTFHKEFRVVAMTTDGLRVINRESYLELIKAKKIGGHKRQLHIESILESEKVMQISLTLSGEKAVFHDHLQLIKQDEIWQIIHNSTQVKAAE